MNIDGGKCLWPNCNRGNSRGGHAALPASPNSTRNTRSQFVLFMKAGDNIHLAQIIELRLHGGKLTGKGLKAQEASKTDSTD